MADGPDCAPVTLPPPPTRYVPQGPMHTIVIVEMPPIAEVLKALEEDALPTSGEGPSNSNENPEGPRTAPPIPITGRSLPLLFIRASDGVGYHSGRTIACESVFSGLDLNGPSNTPGANIDTNWLTAAASDSAWTLRVL